MLELHDIKESRIYKEGQQEGQLKGSAEKQSEIILKLLAKGRSPQEIADWLEVDLRLVEQAQLRQSAN